MQPGGVLFLDLARAATGWAYGHDLSAHPVAGAWELPGESTSMGRGMSFASLGNELTRFILNYRPARVGHEAPLVASAQSHAMSARLQIGCAALVEEVCYRQEIEPEEYSVSHLRAEVIGRSRRTKLEIAAAIEVKDAIVAPWVRRMGWVIGDHNARDAAVGLAYMLGYRHQN